MSASSFQVGLEGTTSIVVSNNHTARSLQSGTLDVFGTPALVALMESAACNAISNSVDPRFTSVGTEMSMKHIAATPVGATVMATAKLVRIEKKALHFEVNARDDKELIGSGTHVRALVEIDKFMQRVRAKI